MIVHAFLLPIALAWDTLIGDPRGNWHPVVLIGKLIAFLEKSLLKADLSATDKKIRGTVLVLLVVPSVYAAAWGVVQLTAGLPPIFAYLVQGLLLSFTISPRALKEAGMEIHQYLQQGNLAEARKKVGWIVGRDTDKLDEGEITRATVETVAENITDGILSPFFFAVLGGVPLAFAYRAVNTLDSMVGYKNDKYLDFGMPAARFDDVCNWIPARLTAVTLLMATCICGYDIKGAYACLKRDASLHPSPNSGWAEATVAGALGVQLGGLNYYFGRPSLRARMGDAVKQLKAVNISETIKLMYTATLLFAFWACAIAFAIGYKGE